MGKYELNKNLAQMLKGGVIMDVTNAEQAKIAEAAGACAVMALERVPADIRRDDQSHSESCFYSGDGQSENRSFCGSSDIGSHRYRLYR